MSDLLAIEKIQNHIFTLRGLQIMLDEDIALLYEVETRVLNQAVKRNIERLPTDFMFQLTEGDLEFLRSQFATLHDDSLRSQSVTLKKARGLG